jgi:hypothetical protein
MQNYITIGDCFSPSGTHGISCLAPGYSGARDPVLGTPFRPTVGLSDPAKQLARYRWLQQRVVRQAYWVPLFYRPEIALAGRHLKGLNKSWQQWPLGLATQYWSYSP